MCPPGLALRLASPSARSTTPPQQPGGRYYFDWGKTAKSQRKGDSPFTPAVPLFLGLDVALDMIEEEGLENVFARHDAARPRHPRRRRRRSGLELFGDPDERSTVVTAIELPDDDRRRQGPGRAAQARHHRQRRPGPAQGPDPADRPLRLLRRLRHPDVAVGPGDGARPARPRGRARRRRRRRPAGVPRGRRPRRGVSTCSTEQYQRPRQGEDRRLRRRPAARALRRRRRRRLDRRGARRSASATTTGS